MAARRRVEIARLHNANRLSASTDRCATRRVVAALCLALFVARVDAVPIFTGLGFPEVGPDGLIQDVSVAALSADGTTAVGRFQGRITGVSTNTPSALFATSWTETGGTIAFAPPPIPGAPGNDFARWATAVNADGSLIAGRADGLRFFRHDATTDTTVFYGPELRLRDITGISADGNTITGRAFESNETFPFRLLGTSLDDRVRLTNPIGVVGAAGANAIAGNASIVVGTAGGRAVWWDSSGVGTLIPDLETTSAFDVNSNGSIVVGGGSAGAFRWDTAMSSVEVLDSLFDNEGNDWAIAVSDHGSRAVGFSDGVSVLWDEHDQVTSLVDLFQQVGLETSISNWDLDTVVDISADGRTIIGNGRNPLGKEESWIAVIDTIPERPLDPNVVWSGELDDGLWHSVIGGETNWLTNPEDREADQEIAPPPGADGSGIVGIFDDEVTLNGTPAGQSVTSIESLFATGSLALNAPLALNGRSSAENVTIDSDVTTEDKLVLEGANRWRAGKISGAAANVAAGDSKIELINATASLDIEAGDKSLDTNLHVSGGASATQFGGTLRIGNGAVLTVDTGSNYFIENGSIVSAKAIINKGEFAKGSLANEVTIDAPLQNDGGIIAVNRGTLVLNNLQTHNGGSYDVASGATLAFDDALTTVSGSLNASGNGDVWLKRGIYRVANVDDQVTFDLDGPLGLNIAGVVTVDAIGTITNKGNATFDFGDLEGGQVKANNTSFEGGFNNALDGVLRIVGDVIPKTISGLLQNNGTIDHQERSTISIEETGVIVNRSGGVYRITGDSTIINGITAGRFENAGGTFETLKGATENSDRVFVSVPLHVSQGGTIKVNQGTTLDLRGESTNTGSGRFNVDGTLLLHNQTFDGDFRIAGNGTTTVNNIVLKSGELALTGNRLHFADSSSEIASQGGTFVVDGTSLEDTPGTLIWGSGEVSASAAPAGTEALINRGGDVVIDQTGTLFPRLTSATFRNRGALRSGSVIQKSTLLFHNARVINDHGGVWRIEAESDRAFSQTQTSNEFENNGGTFTKTGDGQLEVFVAFRVHEGAVNVEGGRVLLRSGGSNGFSASANPGGEFTIAAGAILDFFEGQHVYGGDYAARGEGTLKVANETIFTVSDRSFTLNLTGPGKAMLAGAQAGGFSGGLLINKGNLEWASGLLGQFHNDLGASMTITPGESNATPKRLAGGINENRGTINHALGAVVDGNGTSVGSLNNTGIYNLHGEFSFPSGSAQQITFRNQVGGIFRLAETGVQRTYDGRFINSGSVVVDNGSTLRLREVPTHLLNHEGDPSGLLATGRWIANANATIELGGANARRIARNEAAITLRGNGRVLNLPDADEGDFDLDFENAGSLRLLESTIYRAPGDFVNEGILEVDGTSELLVAGNFTSAAGSSLTVDQLLAAQGEFINDGGITSGRGIVLSTGYSNIAGTINPGNSPGIMTIMSNYSHGTDATLIAEIGGPVAGDEYDQLIVDGTATIDGGILDLRLWADFAPRLGDTFDVLIADLIIGVFDSIEQPLVGGEPLFGVSIVDLVAQNQHALQVVALRDYSAVPLPPALLLFSPALLALLRYRREPKLSSR